MKLLIKDVKVKLLETGDKQGEIVLRTQYAEDVSKLAHLIDQTEIEVDFKNVVPKDRKEIQQPK